ncbi:MAG: QueT transporter family protein, partial [Lachnospiraceae bacterium]|nr:QueT transporter family protein [Lachnospiraceae bacterium]
MNNNSKVLFMSRAAMIAALYVILTMFAAGFDLASGAIQVRFSEALTILPFFTPAAVPGLAIGCLISNIITGCNIFDIIFGTLANFIGAAGTYALRKHRYLCTIPPVISNTIIV